MSVTAVVGANWGDEGKGRMVDALALRSDRVVRFQGGANAGHTVIGPHGKIVLRLLPSGALHPHVLNVLGPGVAVDADVLDRELDEVAGRTGHRPRLMVSERAQLVLPHHRLLDALEEQRLAGSHGIYPYVTSSSPLAGFAAVGAGLPPAAINRVVAVTKAYSSCVGAGPFVTEQHGEPGDELRRRGGDAGEFGAVTGRPRRVGPFGYLPEIPLCTAYRIADRRTPDFPTTRHLATATPKYEALPGWLTPISDIRRLQDLPPAARRYLDRIETLVGVPIRWVSVGPHRDAPIEC